MTAQFFVTDTMNRVIHELLEYHDANHCKSCKISRHPDELWLYVKYTQYFI